jgi:hypothetical protein
MTGNYTTTMFGIAVTLMWVFFGVIAWLVGLVHKTRTQEWYENQNEKKGKAKKTQGPGVMWFMLAAGAIYSLKAFSHACLTLYPINEIFPDGARAVYLSAEAQKGPHIAVMILLFVDYALNILWLPTFSGSLVGRRVGLMVIATNIITLVVVIIVSFAGGLFEIANVGAVLDVFVVISLIIQILWLFYVMYLNMCYINDE